MSTLLTFDQEQEIRKRSAIQDVMGMESGRRFVSNVLDSLGWMLPIYAPDHGNLAYNVGRHESARQLYASLLDAQPELVRVMLAEKQERLDAAERGSKS